MSKLNIQIGLEIGVMLIFNVFIVTIIFQINYRSLTVFY